MADIISLRPQPKGPKNKPKGPQGLQCPNCSSTTFGISPDSIITCCTCNYVMELVVPQGTLYLRPWNYRDE